jgi:acyl-CoA dehydrogenase
MQMLSVERLVLAIGANATTRELLRDTIYFCAQRRTPSARILDYQNTRFQLSELVSHFEIQQPYLDTLINSVEERRLDATNASIAKLRTTELLKKAALAAVQFKGAASITYDTERPVSSDLMDACVQTIWGGPSEVMRSIISNKLEAWARS